MTGPLDVGVIRRRSVIFRSTEIAPNKKSFRPIYLKINGFSDTRVIFSERPFCASPRATR